MTGKVFQHFLLVVQLMIPSVVWAGNPIVLNESRPIQSQLRNKNGIYVVRTDIDLKGETLSIPYNSVLKFEGGSLKNGTITYNDTYIEGRYCIQCKCEGIVANDIVDPRMYGARGDGKTDDSFAIQQSIDSKKQVIFHRSTYLIEKPLVFDRQNFIVDFNLSTLKKTNKEGYNYKYENYNYNTIPCLILIKPYSSNTSGHIVIRNLIIDGGKTNTGIHAIWCRNVILENVRIYGATKGFVYNGFTNSFRDITIWDSNEGFVLFGGGATLFERCFSTKCGWDIRDATGLTLVACSSDDFDPCYRILNSSVTMTGCTFESKGLGLDVDNSVVEISGDFQTHIYDSTKSLTYIKARNNSVVRAPACNFRLNNYMKKKVPSSNLFESYNNSQIIIDGKIIHDSSDIRIGRATGGIVRINGVELNNGKNKIK